MDGHEDCAVDVTVAVEPDTQAYCNLEGVEGGISFKCAHNDGYCPRGATIQYRKKGDSTWATFGKKTSSYAVTKTDLDAGVYEVKYNLLNVMGCEGEVMVRAGEITDFNKQMSAILPEFQRDPSSSVARIQTRVTAIVDGDSLRTEYTDNPSVLPPPNPSYAQQRIRIIGYDSEECEDYPDVCAPGGKEAGDMLKKLIPVGSEIELRVYRWLPLGAHNRIIAGVFKNGVDIAKKMLNSCLVVLAASKYYDKYPWIKWKGEDSYEEAWCDPNETNVTISTSDVYGASMNVDVIMFDDEMKSSAEGGVTIKKVRPGKHTVEIRDDILKDKKLWAFVQPLNQAFKAPCIFEIDVRPGETYRVRVKLGVKAGEPVDNARQITFSASPLSARIHVGERVYVQMTGEVTKIPMTIGKSQSIEYQANDYAPLKAELLVTADNIKCTATDVCGYKTNRPYVLVTKDYVRAFLKSLPTADFRAESFDEWMRKKGGAEGISTDEVLRISQAYKGKKDIGFMPTLDNIIDAVSGYLDRKP
jgi:endonuclease YncB( thermonuclease family)